MAKFCQRCYFLIERNWLSQTIHSKLSSIVKLLVSNKPSLCPSLVTKSFQRCYFPIERSNRDFTNLKGGLLCSKLDRHTDTIMQNIIHHILLDLSSMCSVGPEFSFHSGLKHLEKGKTHSRVKQGQDYFWQTIILTI